MSLGARLIPFLLIISTSLGFIHCGGGGGGSGDSVPDVTIGDGGDFDPTGDEDPIDSGDEICENTDTVSISPSLIDFGLDEVNRLELQAITVNACLTFSAEIDDLSDPEFVLCDEEGNELSGRASNQEEVVYVCYKRSSVGTHKGQVNVVVDGGSATYASVISLTGKTIDAIFQVAQPEEGQLVWEGVSDYNSTENVFVLTALFSVNPSEDLQSILTSDSDEVTISAGGETQTVSAASGQAEIHIPGTPAIYPVIFSINTTEGELATTVNVVRFTRPDGSIVVRDNSGEIISAMTRSDGLTANATETDNSALTAGIEVDNLDVSGPSVIDTTGAIISKHPVEIELTLTKPDGSVEKYSKSDGWVDDSDESEPVEFYVNYDFGEEEGENGLCPDGFSDPSFTYCIPLPSTAELDHGTSTLTATLCNEFTDYESGCVTATTTIIVDGDLPVITITEPDDNEVYGEKAKPTLTGTIENFQWEEDVTDEDGKVTGTNCLAKLWVNASLDKLNSDGTENAISLCDYLTVVSGEDGGSANGNKGNTRKATFSVPLKNDWDGSGYHNLTLYTNLLMIRAQDANGHAAFAVKSFQRGDYGKSHLTGLSVGNGKALSLTGDLTTEQLGTVSTLDGSTERAPLMLDISEGTLNDSKILEVVKKYLNDNLRFDDLAMGGGLIEDEDGNVEPIGTGTIATANMEEIEEMLHGTAPEQVRALQDYQRLNGKGTYFSQEMSQDACGYPITTAMVTPNVYQYLFPWHSEDDWMWDSEYTLREWPGACGENKDCNTFEQGTWDISIDLKDNGYVDVVLSLEGKTDETGRKLPAVWGHFTAYNLVEEGTTGAYPLISWLTGGLADPVIPLLLNLSRLEIRLKDVLRVYKVQKNDDGSIKDDCRDPETNEQIPCACSSGNCTNMLYIDQDALQKKKTALLFEPYEGCYDYFQEKYPGYNTPYGCTPSKDQYFPFLIDTTSDQGYLLWLVPGQEGNDTALLTLMRDVFDHTFKNILSCLGTQLVNPLFDPQAFPYPKWVPEDSRITDMTMALDDTGDGVEFVLEEDAKNPVFTFTPNIKEADILVQDGSLQLKLPLSMGASGVSASLIRRSPFASSSTSTDADDTIRGNGYMYRDFDVNAEASCHSDAGYQYPPNCVEEKPYLGMSVAIEEFLNSATHLLWKKGPLVVLDLMDEDLADDLDLESNWSVGIDKVILGRLGICERIDILSADLPPSTLFADIEYLFSSDAIHLDISLNKDYPPTLALLPYNGDSDAALVQLGLSNVQVDVKNLDKAGDTPDCEGKEDTYCIGSSVVKLRLDLLLKLIVKYDRTSREMEIYLLPLEETPLFISLADRGLSYNDNDVTNSLRKTILPQVWGNFAPSDPSAGATTPSIRITLPDSAVGLGASKTVTTDEEIAEAEGYDGLLIENHIASRSWGDHCRPNSYQSVKQVADDQREKRGYGAFS
ncbi:MAG: hypothetical protein HYU99_07460 [Deltaproteobacteria bacterium]|nr:hypothetical protein [Deltaproteobacteria bacterium]